MRDEEPRTVDPKHAHPIQDDSLDRTIKTYDADDLDRDRIHEVLAKIQQYLESERLNLWLHHTRGHEAATLERIYRDDNAWAFVEYDTPAWDDVLDEVGVEDSPIRSIVPDAHLFETQMLDTEQEGTQFGNDDMWDTFLIGKTPGWRETEEQIRGYFAWLAGVGCSPAQMIDHWMCEVMGMKQSRWAMKRNVDRASVNENVAAASKLLEVVNEERDGDPIDMKKKREGQGPKWILAEENIQNEFIGLAGKCSIAEALDYWACELHNAVQTEWADHRSATQSTVSENVNDARDKMNNEYYVVPDRSEIYEEMEEANES